MRRGPTPRPALILNFASLSISLTRRAKPVTVESFAVAERVTVAKTLTDD